MTSRDPDMNRFVTTGGFCSQEIWVAELIMELWARNLRFWDSKQQLDLGVLAVLGGQGAPPRQQQVGYLGVPEVSGECSHPNWSLFCDRLQGVVFFAPGPCCDFSGCSPQVFLGISWLEPTHRFFGSTKLIKCLQVVVLCAKNNFLFRFTSLVELFWAVQLQVLVTALRDP